MAFTRRERIVQRVMVVLNEPGKPTGLNLHRQRTRPLERETQLPAGVVYITIPPLGGESETVDRLDHDPGVERRLNLRIEWRQKGPQPDQVLDPLYAWGVRAMRADPTLDGLAKDVREVRSSFDAYDFGNGPVGACASDWEIIYETDEDDPVEGPNY